MPFTYNDLSEKNRKTEIEVQKLHVKNNTLLSEIAEEKKNRFSVMREDLNAAGQFLNEVEREGEYVFDLSESNSCINLSSKKYSLRSIRLSMAGGVKNPDVKLVFTGSSQRKEKEISVPESDYYSGKSLSDDARLLDNTLLDWDDIRSSFNKKVRTYGKTMIENKRKKIEEETALINDVNSRWIKKMKEEEAA